MSTYNFKSCCVCDAVKLGVSGEPVIKSLFTLHTLLALFVCCVLLPVQAAELAQATPEQLGVSTAALAKVDAFMAQQVEQQQIAGGIVMISYKGKICFFHAYGKRDREADLPMHKDTIFRLYSMTKAITSAAALKLYEEGRIGLNDPVSKYIPNFKNLQVATKDGLRPPSRPVTVKDLMLHISGITYGDGPEALQKAWKTQNPWVAHDLADFVERLAKVPLAFDPGTDWHYGAGISVLGRVVEVASGQTLDSYLKKTFFDPLDMRDTGFYVPTNKLDRFAAVYEPVEGGGLKRQEKDQPEPLNFSRPATLFLGGGGLVSTARDYMRFLSMIEREGELDGIHFLKPQTVALMTSNQLPESAFPIDVGDGIHIGEGFGLGFAVHTGAKADTNGPIGEYGWGGAASTHYWLQPESKLIVVTMEQVMPFRPDTESGIKSFVYDAIGSGE